MDHPELIAFIVRSYAGGSGYVGNRTIIELLSGTRIPVGHIPDQIYAHLEQLGENFYRSISSSTPGMVASTANRAKA
jgi:hypothetical protein